MIDRNCRKFEREALKCLRQLPDKQSIPPVSDMSILHYIMIQDRASTLVKTRTIIFITQSSISTSTLWSFTMCFS